MVTWKALVRKGRTDVPLTELGTAQAEALAARISAEWRPRAVYTSPMTRCVTTGARIAKRCGITAQVLEDLNDLDYGQWDLADSRGDRRRAERYRRERCQRRTCPSPQRLRASSLSMPSRAP